MKIRPMEKIRGGRRVEVELELEGKAWKVYYQSSDAPLAANLEAILALGLLPAMRRRQTIYTSGSASVLFLVNLEKVQDFFLEWKPNYSRVAIKGAEALTDIIPGGDRVGLFFSAGLDSFFSLFRHMDEITDLIFIHGFDIPPDRLSQIEMVSQAVRKVADQYGKRLVEVDTNASTFATYYLPGHQVYGAILASVGYLLYPSFHKIYIAAAHTYDTLEPNGSHPDLDPLWSSEGLEFFHDGIEATRLEKAARVGQSQIAMETLHVCLENRGGAYNCGKCQKCLRTMIDLRMTGTLERCKTFDMPLDLKRVARLRPQRSSRRVFLEEILEALESDYSDPELEQAVRKALADPDLVKRVLMKIEKLRFRGERRRRFQVRVKSE